MIKVFLQKSSKVLWAAFLVSLPVTNFPYFPTAMGGSRVSVRPLLIYPLFFLILLILPTLWKRKLPRVWLPFLVFILLALISSLIPVFSGVVSELSEITVGSRVFRTVFTLFLAGGIYLVVSLMPIKEEDLDFTLKWLYIGLTISLIWGSLQLIYVLDLIPNWFSIMKSIQDHITISPGKSGRLNGLTQEPSWFADQLASLYLPWIYSAVLVNRSVFKRISKWLTVEMILFGWIGLILVFTLSRSGYLTAAAVLGVGLLFFRKKQPNSKESTQSNGLFWSIRRKILALPSFIKILISAVLMVSVLGVVGYFASRGNGYISAMWDNWITPSGDFQFLGGKSLSVYIRSIGFGPRFLYWETAFNIFKTYPLFGVGLGNYSIYFQDFLPAQQVGYMPEILRILVPYKSSIITAKNYFARLLAETGLFGTTAYISFLIVITGEGWYLWLSKEQNQKFWGAGILLGMIAFLMSTFSYDSFAIPNPWIVFGLATAAFQIFRQTESENKEKSN